MGKEKLLEDKDLKWINEKVARELEPFLDGLRMKSATYEAFRRTVQKSLPRIEQASEITIKLDDDYKKVKSELYATFSYLGFVESLGNTTVDMVVLLLIANGIDFHIECQHRTPRMIHATKIEDLERERVSLTTKLNFLRDNGLKVFTSLIDTKLRNKIAHMKFEVRGNRVFVDNKHLSVIQLFNSTRKTIQALIISQKLILDVMKEKGFKN